jgi:hypothetical protein
VQISRSGFLKQDSPVTSRHGESDAAAFLVPPLPDFSQRDNNVGIVKSLWSTPRRVRRRSPAYRKLLTDAQSTDCRFELPVSWGAQLFSSRFSYFTISMEVSFGRRVEAKVGESILARIGFYPVRTALLGSVPEFFRMRSSQIKARRRRYFTEYPRASMQAENPRLKVSICLLYAALA